MTLTAPNGISMRVGTKADVTKYFEKEGKGEVYFAVENSEVLSIDGSKITALKEGKANVQISGGDFIVNLPVEVVNERKVKVGIADVTANYDGHTYNVVQTGDKLPDGSEVKLFHNGEIFNGASKAGKYEVTMEVTLPNGYSADYTKKTAILNIQKAKYDTSSFSFSDATYEYDGREHSVFLTGELPEGISVRYENNRATEAGTYQARAIFSGEDENYEKIETKTVKLIINKKIFALIDHGFASREKTYDGEEISAKITDLPSGATAKLFENGEEKSEVKRLTAGVTTATATLTINEDLYKNYLFTSSDKILSFEKTGNAYVSESTSVTLAVKKATLSTQKFVMKNKNGETAETMVYGSSVTFGETGGDVCFLLEGTGPFGVKNEFENVCSFTITEPEKNAYGHYDCGVAHTVVLQYVLPENYTENYEEVKEVRTTFTVKRATFDVGTVTFSSDMKEKTYDGEKTEIKLDNVDEDVLSVRYVVKKDGGFIDEILHAGFYVVSAKLSLKEDALNYEPIPDVTFEFTVLPVEITVGDFTFESKEYVYDGEGKTVEIGGSLPEKFTVEYSPKNTFTNAGKYTVTARFYYDRGVERDDDYVFYISGEKKKSLTATLTIDKATFTPSDVESITAQDDLTYYFGMKFSAVGLSDENAQWKAKDEKIGEMTSLSETSGYVDGEAVYNVDKSNYEDYSFTVRVYLKKGELDVRGASVPTQFIEKRGETYGDATILFGENKYPNEVSAVTEVSGDSITVTLFAEKENNYYFTGERIFENVTAYFYDPTEYVFERGTLTLAKHVGSGKTAVLPYGVKRVVKNAFDTTGVTEIVFPETVTEIEKNALSGATLLQEVEFYNVSGLPGSIKSVFGTNFYGDVAVKIVECAEIPNGLFSGCSFVRKVEISSPIVSVGRSAFYGCTNLKTLDFDVKNLCSLGENAFSECFALESLTVPFLMNDVGESATLLYLFGSKLSDCALKKVVFESESAYRLASNAFKGAAALENIVFSSGLQSVGSSAFYGVKANIDLSATALMSVGGKVFNGYDGESVILPDSLTSLEAYAFTGLTSVNTLALPKNVTTIGKYAFQGCSADIVFNENSPLVSIGESVFEGYLGASVRLPNAVTTIGKTAFKNASSLHSVTMQNVQVIGENAFEGCVSLGEMTLSSALTDVKSGAFKNCSRLTLVFNNPTPPTPRSAAYDTGAVLTAFVPTESILDYKRYFESCGKGDGAEVLSK